MTIPSLPLAGSFFEKDSFVYHAFFDGSDSFVYRIIFHFDAFPC